MEDDDFDSFLAEVTASSSTSVSQTTPNSASPSSSLSLSANVTTPNAQSLQSLEDEFSELFSSSNSPPTTPKSAATAVVVIAEAGNDLSTTTKEANSSSKDESGEFLNWLSEPSSAAKDPSNARSSEPSVAPSASSTTISAASLEAEHGQTQIGGVGVGGAKAVSVSVAVDLFLAEVYGSNQPATPPSSPLNKVGSKSLGATLLPSLPLPPPSSSSSSSPQPLPQPSSAERTLRFEERITALVSSSFPDVVALRRLLLTEGPIPPQLRGPIWSLLLTGSVSEDQEVAFYQSTGLELSNHARLAADCEAVVSRSQKMGGIRDEGCGGSSLGMGDSSSSSSSSSSAPSPSMSPLLHHSDRLQRDLVDILVLFCVRREIDYHPMFAHLLAPLIATDHPVPRLIASSLFHSLASRCVVCLFRLPCLPCSLFYSSLVCSILVKIKCNKLYLFFASEFAIYSLSLSLSFSLSLFLSLTLFLSLSLSLSLSFSLSLVQLCPPDIP